VPRQNRSSSKPGGVFLPLLAVALVVTLAVALAPGCSRAPDKTAAAGPFRIEVRSDPSPAALGPTRLTLRVQDGDRLLSGGEVKLRAFMDGMPMNTDELWIPAAGDGKGSYTAEVDFSMGGEWTVLASVRRGAEEPAQARIPFTIVWELP